MAFEPQPLEQEDGTRNSVFAPKPVDYRDGEAIVVPAPPDEGTFVLTSTDGVLSWEEPAEPEEPA